jgi:hypothetical protein
MHQEEEICVSANSNYLAISSSANGLQRVIGPAQNYLAKKLIATSTQRS